MTEATQEGLVEFIEQRLRRELVGLQQAFHAQSALVPTGARGIDDLLSVIGASTGLPLGEYHIGPWSEKKNHPLQHPNAGAYPRKDMSGYWAYYPEG